MDKLILGLLLIKNFNIYEIRSIIRKQLQSLCSDSMGSIQAAIKKLLSSDMIDFREYVENGKKKKQYFILDKGRESFFEWVNKPMDTGKGRNMEVGKLYFMGFVEKEKRVELISTYLEKLEQELEYMNAVKQAINLQKELQERAEDFIAQDDNGEFVKDINKMKTMEDAMEDIAIFALLSLKLGIDNLEFETSWYKSLKEKMIRGDVLL